MVKERLARGFVIVGLMLVASIPILFLGHPANAQGIVLHARLAESGGWTPENLTAQVGEPLHLHLISDDVTHGFAIGKLDQPAVDVNPGEMTDITVVFTQPGKYTFYCTRWCGVNHWRMRGTIEVSGGQPANSPIKQPLYVSMGMNIDASHASSNIPSQIPSAWRGALLKRTIPSTFSSREYYLSHPPMDLWSGLRAEPTTTDLTDQEIWDLVAWVWQSHTTPDQIQAGRQLFSSNCAACHGVTGGGNGVFASQLAASSDASSADPGEHTQRPADFSNPSRMLSASPALLQGKILRGGMGTGMPSWGAIFTEDQTWALVAYLWLFQFQMEVHP